MAEHNFGGQAAVARNPALVQTLNRFFMFLRWYTLGAKEGRPKAISMPAVARAV